MVDSGKEDRILHSLAMHHLRIWDHPHLVFTKFPILFPFPPHKGKGIITMHLLFFPIIRFVEFPFRHSDCHLVDFAAGRIVFDNISGKEYMRNTSFVE